MSRIKRAVCAAVSTAFGMSLLCLSVPQPISAYDSQTESTSSTISRDYQMHQCSSASNTSFTPYTLTYNSNTLSVPSNTRDYPTYDNRVPDEDSRIVRLTTLSGAFLGTGFIVDDYTIATAAHCIYNANPGQKHFNSFVIELYENGTVAETITPVSLHIPANFATATTNHGRAQYDYGLITVDDDLYDYGAFHLGVAQDAFMNSGANVSVSGFPSTGQNGDNTSHQLYKGTGAVIPVIIDDEPDAQDYLIRYEAFTSGSESGSPVYYEQSIGSTNYQTVLGIHTARSEGYFGSGVRITFPVLMFYYNNPNL